MICLVASESPDSLKDLLGVHICEFLFQFIFMVHFGLRNFIYDGLVGDRDRVSLVVASMVSIHVYMYSIYSIVYFMYIYFTYMFYFK